MSKFSTKDNEIIFNMMQRNRSSYELIRRSQRIKGFGISEIHTLNEDSKI